MVRMWRVGGLVDPGHGVGPSGLAVPEEVINLNLKTPVEVGLQAGESELPDQ